MRKLCIVLLIGFVFVTNLYANYGWPLKDFDVQHQIIGTFGEYRTGHFHSAVDINAPESTMVWNIETDTCYISGSGINIGHFRYFHLAGFRVDNLSLVSAGDSIAKTDSDNHIHMMECRTELNVYGDPANVWWLEPLRSGALTPFIDSVSPTIYWTRFYEKDTGGVAYGDSISSDSLQGRIDILSSAGDMRTDSTGHSAGGNCSIYRIGYLVKDTLGNIVKPYWEKIKFDSVYNHKDTSRLNQTYGPGSSNSIFRYWVSNDPFNSNSDLRNWYWNTKQQDGQPDSVDADSIEVAKFKDGFYWVKVYAYDIKNNADSESVYVHVDNFNPKIKEKRPIDWFAFVPTKEKRVWCRFSEQMDSTTLTATNIKIQSLKSDSFNYPIINITYIDSIYKLYIEVDSFRFKDTGQEIRISGYQRIREFKNNNFQINTILNIKLCRSFFEIICTLDKYYIVSIIIKEKRRYEGLAEVFAS